MITQKPQRKYFSLVLLISILSACVSVEKTPEPDFTEITQKLESLTETFSGDVGVYVKHLPTGREININADSLLPTASMIKIPIMLALFDRIEGGALDYDSTLMWFPGIVNYPADGILSSFRDSSKISLTKLISLMITYSDNHASLWCQELAGGGLRINEWLIENGFEKTRMNSRTPDRSDDWEIYGWGQTTPREMAELITLIHKNEAVTPWASEEMYRYLTRIYWDDEALSQLPRTVQAASKQGAVNESRSEVVLVNAPHGDYVFCVITNNQSDVSWEVDNEGFVLIREVSKLLWDRFQ